MAFQLNSTAEYYGEAIDCRCLSFAFEFYRLSSKQVIDISTELVLWLDSLMKEGFISKKFDTKNKSVTIEHALSQLKTRVCDNLGWSYSLESYVVSSIVYNQKTMASYRKSILTETNTIDVFPGVSVDYPQYWKDLFPNGREGNDQIKQKIIRLFREENRSCKTVHPLSDVQALISISPYRNSRGSFFGNFEIDFSAFCLREQLAEMTKCFSDYAKYIAGKYVNVNARVRLQPVGKTHMRYFGNDAKIDNSHIEENCEKIEWYSTYYLPEAEWLNIISPLTRTHLPKLAGNMCISGGILLEELQGGGLLIKSQKEIDQYGIDEALELKKLVYPALYPGSSYQSLSKLFQERDLFKQHSTNFWFSGYPRSDWAIVPVLEEEIKIVATYLVFSYAREIVCKTIR